MVIGLTIYTALISKVVTHLDDYVYCNTSSKPLSIVCWLQEESSGAPYQVANHVSYANFSISHQNFLATFIKVTGLKYYQEAVKDPHWTKPIEEEIRALEKNKMWALHKLLHEKKPISCKWVY